MNINNRNLELDTNDNADNTAISLEDHIISQISSDLESQSISIYDVMKKYNINNQHQKVKKFLTSITRTINVDTWNRYIKMIEVECRWGGYPNNAIEFFEMFVDRSVIEWSPTGVRIHGNDMILGESDLLVKFKNAVLKENLRYTRDDIDTAYSSYKLSKEERDCREFREKIEFDTTLLTSDELQNTWSLIRSCVFPDHDVDFVRRVIESFMWQVKRKLFGRTIPQPMLTVFTGSQNQGKSYFISNHLLGCIPKTFWENSTFTNLLDDRNHDIKKKYIVFLDEMEHADRADINRLKNFITSSGENSRMMYSNSSTHVVNKTTLIGCSNGTIDQAINDRTGYRRFVSLTYRLNPDIPTSEIHSFLDSVNWLNLWKSVSEDSDQQPSELISEKISEQQAENVDDSSVLKYLSDITSSRVLLESVFRNDGSVEAFRLFSEYFNWAEQRHRSRGGVPFSTDSSFGKELKRLIQHNEINYLAKDRRKAGIVYCLVNRNIRVTRDEYANSIGLHEKTNNSSSSTSKLINSIRSNETN